MTDDFCQKKLSNGHAKYTIRVEQAKELLKNPAYRVGDVAEKVGFLDIAHFSRVFKKITGVSANEFRNQMK